MGEPAHMAAHNVRELLVFRVGEQEFCVDIMAVKEIRSGMQITPLPHSPPYLCGLVNLRGVVLPILNMALRLGFDAGEAHRGVIIVVWIGQRLVGLQVDAVCDILPVPQNALQPTPEVASNSMEGFVSAIITPDERMICLLALETLLPQDVEAA
jgi:purine-binding chemotaxis protein CheW